MITNTIQEIADKLWAEDNFILVGHQTPDGDCIGSLIGLHLGLMRAGKKCVILLNDPVPPIYRFLAGADKIKMPGERVSGDIIIYLDCSDAERVGDMVPQCITRGKYSINIDHHYTNDYFAEYNLVEAQAAATAEIIVKLLKVMEISLDVDIASALYTGIVMDTGRFNYSNTTGETLRIAADLLETGLNLNAIRISLFESRPIKEIEVLGEALRSLSLSDDGKLAWFTLSYDQLAAINAVDVYPEDIINYTRMIAGVEVGISFREIEPGKVKIGFRSKNDTDVAKIAAKWGGGGHRQASGAVQTGNLEEVKKLVIASVRDVLK